MPSYLQGGSFALVQRDDLGVQENGQVSVVGIDAVHQGESGAVCALRELVRRWGVELGGDGHQIELGVWQSSLQHDFDFVDLGNRDLVTALGVLGILLRVVGDEVERRIIASAFEVRADVRWEVVLESSLADLRGPDAPEVSPTANAVDRAADVGLRPLGALHLGLDSVIHALIPLGRVARAAVEVGPRGVEDVGGEDDSSALNEQDLILAACEDLSERATAKAASYDDVVVGVELAEVGDHVKVDGEKVLHVGVGLLDCWLSW